MTQKNNREECACDLSAWEESNAAIEALENSNPPPGPAEGRLTPEAFRQADLG